jgi:acyl carrier protein
MAMNRTTEQHDRAAMNDQQIRQVLRAHGRLSRDAHTMGSADDLYEAGMTSHASVNVMLGIEDAFDLEFPDEMLRRATFQSIKAINAAVESLLQKSA